jgi:ATP adenylyltransferase
VQDLWTWVEEQAERALSSGALHRIDTTASLREENGIPFVVRRATNLARKAEAKDDRDPFEHPEPDLFVADLSPTHYALLNKYNVLERHLLAVTRAYVDQEEPLDAADFDALARCIGDGHVLGFYNGGAFGGASQPHKHLQIVRLPLSPFGRAIPMEAAIEHDPTLETLPYRCRIAMLDNLRPETLLARYRELRDDRGPYNLVVARNWMLYVPRSRPAYAGIAVNALAFAGALFVRDEAQMRVVEREGPMAVLKGVTLPRD